MPVIFVLSLTIKKNTMQSNFKIGEIIKYSKPANNTEAAQRFIVIEIHPECQEYGEKIHFEEIIDHMNLKPQGCYFATEFTKA